MTWDSILLWVVACSAALLALIVLRITDSLHKEMQVVYQLFERIQSASILYDGEFKALYSRMTLCDEKIVTINKLLDGIEGNLKQTEYLPNTTSDVPDEEGQKKNPIPKRRWFA